jgi:energy-coupling factor transporter transmembrane protein EcfT
MTARPRDPELTILRLVPRDSVVHRLWAGTKLILVAELALMLSISPSWAMLAIGTALLGLGLFAGRIPPGAFPRLPRWFYLLILVGGALSLISGTKPIVHVGGFPLSIGALGEWFRFLGVTVVMIVSGLLVGWTTPLGEVAPALKRLARPLRAFRLPVDEWVISVALAIRCVPLLMDEIRNLAAARKLRVHGEDDRSPATVRALVIEGHDLLATAIVLSIRRARDLAESMLARGGTAGAVSASSAGPHFADAVALVLLTALGITCIWVLHL